MESAFIKIGLTGSDKGEGRRRRRRDERNAAEMKVERVKITRREFAELVLAGVPLAVMGVSREDVERFLLEDEKTGGGIRVMRRPHPLETGKELSLLGYGGIRLPVRCKVTDKRGLIAGYWQDEKVDFDLGCKFIDYAYHRGVNFFDTGYLYHNGESEKLFGVALSKYPRESYFLCDKMPTPHIKSLEHAKEIFEEQLERCKVKYFDNYLLHEIRKDEEWDVKYKKWGVLDYLKEEKRKGRIRHLGFSFHAKPELFKRMLDEEPFECVTILLNAIDWDGPNQASVLHQICQERQIPVWVMEPLCGGRLANLKPAAVAVLKRNAPTKSAADWAFRYAASKSAVACVLSSFSRIEHLKEDIDILGRGFAALTADELTTYAAAISAELSGKKLVPCTECRYCMPCPYGIDIAGLFKWWNDKVKWARTPPPSMKKRLSWLDGIFSVSIGAGSLGVRGRITALDVENARRRVRNGSLSSRMNLRRYPPLWRRFARHRRTILHISIRQVFDIGRSGSLSGRG